MSFLGTVEQARTFLERHEADPRDAAALIGQAHGSGLDQLGPRGLRSGFDCTCPCGHSDHMGKSNMAGARALKTHLGAYLRKVRHGATIVVTDRGQPIAELRPLDPEAGSTHPGLARLLASGAVTRGSTAPLGSFRAIRHKGASLAAAVIEDREERF